MIRKHLIRLTTGFIFGGITTWAIFGFSLFMFLILLTVLMSLTSYEWVRLAKPNMRLSIACVAYITITILATIAAVTYIPLITLSISLLLWLWISRITFKPQKQLAFLAEPKLMLPLGIMLFVPLWMGMIMLKSYSANALFYIIMLVCMSDVGAYFVGSHYGKRKLCPSISPGKTIEGLIGGLIIGFATGMIVSYFLPFTLGIGQYLILTLMSIFILFISSVGDLFESLLKRLCSVKDSSNLLPGHGGALDRLDSLLAGVPIFVLCCILLGWM
ncbi:MAG: hypothetical protein COC15_01700 [Legionellales bacterium]|nr:MAG: hypothetical protein COC15_01700 [Legionellales bacterium]